MSSSTIISVRDPAVVDAAVSHLRGADKKLRRVIDRVGPFTLRRDVGSFRSLVQAIVSQQISWKAARSIYARLRGLLPGGRITPESLAALTPLELRSAGLSSQKMRYLLDLTSKVQSREVRLAKLPRLSDDEIIAELTQVTGVGVWTAQMFLIFTLGRPDVFPHDDLGIRSALRKLHALDELPHKTLSHELAAPWRPYATVASWYLWRSLEK